MSQTHSSTTGLPPGPFVGVPLHVETADVVVRLRSALQAMVAAVATGPLIKSRDAQKLFDVDVKLSWQLFRTLDGTDPLDAVGHIPPRVSFVKLIREARRRQIDAALVDEAEQAYAGFESHIERHAGDRATFARLLRPDGGDPADERPHRQAAFEASRHIWGCEKDANLNVTILHPKAGGRDAGLGDRVEMVSLAALRGFRRWRTTAPVLLTKHKLAVNADPNAANQPQPLDGPTFAEMGVPLLARFCSAPRPALRTRRLAPEVVATELAGEAVGRLNSIDLTYGQFFPDTALMARPDGRLGWELARLNTTPTRVAVLDFIVHRPTFGSLAVETRRWGNLSTFPPSLDGLAADPDVPPLPLVDRVSYVGTAAVAGQSAGVDRYPQLLRDVCDQRGWRLADLDVYRHRSDYPLLSTLDVVTFSIPDSDRWPRRPDA